MEVCRFCMRWEESTSKIEEGTSLGVIKHLFGLEVACHAGFPQHQCQQCRALLENSAMFYEQVVEAEKSLHKLFKTGILESLLSDPKERGETLGMPGSSSDDDTVDNEYESERMEDDEPEVTDNYDVGNACSEIEEFSSGIPRKMLVGITIETVETLELDDVCKSSSEDIGKYELQELSQFAEPAVLEENLSWRNDESEAYNVVEALDVLEEIENHNRKASSKRSVPPEESTYTCNLCGRQFEERLKYSKHMNAHRNMMLERYKCTTCAKAFQSSTLLKRHALIHVIDTPFKCPHCAQGFNHEWNFKLHMRRHEQQGDEYGCDRCNVEYANFVDWRRHMKEHYPDDQRYWDLQDVLPESLQDGTDYPMGCAEPGCTYVGATLRLMWVHYRTHFKAFQCEHCTQKFASAPNLRQHIDLVHRGIRPYECTKCGKRFGYRHKMQEHLNMHNGIRNLKCKYCEKRFSYTSNLTVHERLHTGVRPYKCDLCGELFRTSSAFAKHRGQQDLATGLRVASKKCVQLQLKQRTQNRSEEERNIGTKVVLEGS